MIMRNLLALLGAVLLAFGTTGWFRGWYRVETLPAEPGQSAFRIDVDRRKVAADVTGAVKGVVRALSRNQPDDSPAEPAEK
jgi:hypothetical protein